MSERTLQNHFSNKLQCITKNCRYGLTHFCDGTPNISRSADAKPLPPCPDMRTCEIRRVKVFNKAVWDSDD